jgi:hypothetical protein
VAVVALITSLEEPTIGALADFHASTVNAGQHPKR